MQSLAVLCAKFHTTFWKKIATVTRSLKFDINYKVFSTKLYAKEIFGSREFITIF